MEATAPPLPKPVVKSSTMSQTLIQEVISCSVKAIEENTSDKSIAASIRKNVHSKHPTSTWNCFVGRDLACYVTHMEGYYIYLYVGQLGVCLFAT